MARVDPELVYKELENIGRLEVMLKAEIGVLRDEIRNELRRLSDTVEAVNARSDRMADRIIEMAMVNRGAFREAVAGMRSSALVPANDSVQNTDDWGKSEEKWPPDGYVEMQMP